MKELPICPKCSGFIPNNSTPGAYSGAISRVDNTTEICSSCGTQEALDAFFGERNEVEQAEDELWEAILDFANNADPDLSSKLAEDVSTAIINLKNIVHLTSKVGA